MADNRCQLCHQVPSGVSYQIKSKVLADCKKVWIDFEKETKEAYSHLPVSISSIIEETRSDYAKRNSVELICNKCVQRYNLTTD